MTDEAKKLDELYSLIKKYEEKEKKLLQETNSLIKLAKRLFKKKKR